MNKKALKSLIIFSSIIGTMQLANSLSFENVKPLEDTLDGEVNYYFSPYGKMYYVKKGRGEPLLLIHGIASGVSSFMWRKNFTDLSRYFTVYAIDLPGFGKSEKLPIIYKTNKYIEVIKAFVKDVIGEPCHTAALNQSAAYAIQMEYDNPGIFKKILAVSPTGIYESSMMPQKRDKIVTAAFNMPVIGTFMYNMLVSKSGVKYFMREKAYYNQDLASKYILNHYYKSSRQNGYLSKYAPASFLGGYLNINIANAVADFTAPLLIVWGRNDEVNSIDNLNSFIDLNPNIKYYIFNECGMLPQEEYAVEFNMICRDFFIQKS